MKLFKYAHLAKKVLRNRISLKPELFKLSAAVTYMCNSRCKYCNIWQIYKKDPAAKQKELTKEEYDEIFSRLDLSWLHLSGGEPFLRKDFKDIAISAAERMKNLIVIDAPTNGFLTDRIVETTIEIVETINCNFHLGVSIDGLPEAHNISRGMNDVFEKAISTFKSLRSISNEYDNFHVHINHFLSPLNITRFQEFVEYLSKKNITVEDVSLEVGRKSDLFQNEKMPFEIEEVIKNIDYFLKLSADEKHDKLPDSRFLLRTNYLAHMKNYLKSGNRLPCTALTSEIFLDPYGQIHPCSGLQRTPLATVREINYDINKFLNSTRAKELRAKYKNCRLCWSGCEGVTALIQYVPLSLWRGFN